MRKVVVAIVAILACAWPGFAQDVQVKDQTPFDYAYLDCAGSFQQIPAKIMDFMGAFFKQGLRPAGAMFAMYFNSPQEVPEAELKWLIGMPTAAGAAPAEPLKKSRFDYPKVAVVLHIGPYDKVSETYAKLMAHIDANGWKPAGPALEKYLDNPQTTAPEKLRTEIAMPVARK
jgi:effector-binding domain-containing protein